MTPTERDKFRERIRVADGFVPRAVCEEIVRSVNLTALRDATVADEASEQGRVDKTVRNSAEWKFDKREGWRVLERFSHIH